MRSIMWWERADRGELTTAVQAITQAGGCLVLQGDRESGRTQAAALAEAELTSDGYAVRRIACGPTPSTTFEALAEAWSQLQPTPADHYSMRAQTQIAGRSVPRLATELAQMLQNAVPMTALIFEDIDRDGERAYNYHPVFHQLATRSGRPVVVTYDQGAGPWSSLGDVMTLRDFTRDEVLECLKGSPAAGTADLDTAVELVFKGQAGAVRTVRPLTAYIRLHAWGELVG